MKFEPKISLIIPAYNEEKVIGNVLRTIKESEYPKKKMEIIVVGDCSTDKTDKIIRKFIKDNPKFNIKLLKDKHEGVGAARNLGWKNAKYDIITMLEADHEMTTNYLHEIVKPMKNPKICGVDSTTLPINKSNIIAHLMWHRYYLGEKTTKIGFFKIFRREILKKLNGFNNNLSAYDDQDFSDRFHKMGFKNVRNEKAVLYHTYTDTLKDMWNDNRWRGASIISLVKNSCWKKALRVSLFPLICIPIPFYIIMLFLKQPLKFLGIVGLTVFIFMEFRRMLNMWKNEKWLGILLVPLFDVIDMLLFGVGFVRGIFKLNKKAVK